MPGLLLAAMPATAQMLSSGDNLPTGLPIDPSMSQGQGQGQSGQTLPEPPRRDSSGAFNQSTIYEPISIGSGGTTGASSPATAQASDSGMLELQRLRQPAKPGEFEQWVRDVTGRDLKRYGNDLLIPSARDFSVPATATIPPDYALNIGDTISIALTGSVDGSVNAEIDRNGQIFLPQVGAITLAGVRYRDLRDRVAAAVGRQYRGYDVTVSVQRLRGIRVYVTGFANHPGSYSVNSLSTLVNAVLAAGGPSPGGSFRTIKLYRNGREVTDFDLYRLIREGDRSRDPILQNEDVLFIPPVGQQVAVIGSVNEEAIYEARPGESMDDLLRLAGGPTNVADPSRVILYRQSDQDTVGSRQIPRTQTAAIPVAGGDILQVLPQGTLVRPLERQQAIVRIEGEVNKPGNYYVPPNTPLSEVIAMAGGLTPRAYVYGTRFSRESVRAQQRSSFLEAVDQMELTLAAAPLQSTGLGDAGERQAQLAAAREFLEKLRVKEPDGRVVLDLSPTDTVLPVNLPVENSDRIVVPPRVDTIGVFGAVYRPSSFLLDRTGRRRVRDFVEQAGGTIRGADNGNIFVVRANGSVLTKKRGALNAQVLPGDTVFVPVRSRSSSLFAKIRDISQMVFQLGISAAALAAIQ
jgi:protein involved in polysaccharide export with SLBB domain